MKSPLFPEGFCRGWFAGPLVEDGRVESGFLADVATGLFDGARGRPRHMAHLQVLDEHDRVFFFADRCRALMQQVESGVSDRFFNALQDHGDCLNTQKTHKTGTFVD